jgi:hypothetical protein
MPTPLARFRRLLAEHGIYDEDWSQLRLVSALSR